MSISHIIQKQSGKQSNYISDGNLKLKITKQN